MTSIPLLASIPRFVASAALAGALAGLTSGAHAHVFSEQSMTEGAERAMPMTWSWNRSGSLAEASSMMSSPLMAAPMGAGPMWMGNALFGGPSGWPLFAMWMPSWPLFMSMPMAAMGMGAMPANLTFSESSSGDMHAGSASGSRSASGSGMTMGWSWNGTPVQLTSNYSFTESWTMTWGPVTPVPEPAAVAMMALGLAGAGWWARRRGRANG